MIAGRLVHCGLRALRPCKLCGQSHRTPPMVVARCRADTALFPSIHPPRGSQPQLECDPSPTPPLHTSTTTATPVKFKACFSSIARSDQNMRSPTARGPDPMARGRLRQAHAGVGPNPCPTLTCWIGNQHLTRPHRRQIRRRKQRLPLDRAGTSPLPYPDPRPALMPYQCDRREECGHRPGKRRKSDSDHGVTGPSN